MAQWSISFTNWSDHVFELEWHGAFFGGSNAFSQSPESLLKTSGGVQTMSAGPGYLELLGTGVASMECCWRLKDHDWRFGVKIFADAQPFGLGPRPVWFITSGPTVRPPVQPVWIPSADDPVLPREWPALDYNLKIKGLPEVEHSSLALSIMIDNQS